MCLSPREAEAIIAARDRNDGIVMVGYMRRFAPAFPDANELLPGLGPVSFARVHDVIGRNQLIVDQTAYVSRPDDLPQALLEQRWERGRRLVADAIGDVPRGGRGVPAALRSGEPRSVGHARAARPAAGVFAARQWRDGGYLAALLDYGDYVVSYETGVDEQLRFDAHLEVFGDSPASGSSTTPRTSGTCRPPCTSSRPTATRSPAASAGPTSRTRTPMSWSTSTVRHRASYAEDQARGLPRRPRSVRRADPSHGQEP